MLRKVVLIFIVLTIIACSAQPKNEQLLAKLDVLKNRITALEQRLEPDKKVNPVSLPKNQPANPAEEDSPSKPQLPTATTIDMDDDPVLGDQDAKIAIVEFSDYQCPFCQRFHTYLLPIIKERFIDTGQAKLVYRDLPLNFHPEAENAAVAANCAGEQGKYFEMNEVLFANHSRLSSGLYSQLAADLSLDLKQFETCRNGSEQLEEVRKDREYTDEINIAATPSFFVGIVKGNNITKARYLEGAVPPARFSAIIKQLQAAIDSEKQVANN
jgi:protein-disulfide isomerase